jgi:hypothetical protein
MRTSQMDLADISRSSFFCRKIALPELCLMLSATLKENIKDKGKYLVVVVKLPTNACISVAFP